jgi:hypothetical protein
MRLHESAAPFLSTCSDQQACMRLRGYTDRKIQGRHTITVASRGPHLGQSCCTSVAYYCHPDRLPWAAMCSSRSSAAGRALYMQ